MRLVLGAVFVIAVVVSQGCKGEGQREEEANLCPTNYQAGSERLRDASVVRFHSSLRAFVNRAIDACERASDQQAGAQEREFALQETRELLEAMAEFLEVVGDLKEQTEKYRTDSGGASSLP